MEPGRWDGCDGSGDCHRHVSSVGLSQEVFGNLGLLLPLVRDLGNAGFRGDLCRDEVSTVASGRPVWRDHRTCSVFGRDDGRRGAGQCHKRGGRSAPL